MPLIRPAKRDFATHRHIEMVAKRVRAQPVQVECHARLSSDNLPGTKGTVFAVVPPRSVAGIEPEVGP